MNKVDIIQIDQNSGNPVIETHEYRDVLQKEQTLNHKEVFDYFSTVDKNPHKVDEMLKNLFYQPAMENAYRVSRIEPEDVNGFIAQVLKLPEIDKRNLINDFYASYANAAKANDGFVNGLPTISGEKEWNALGENLTRYPNLKHLQWKLENDKALEQPAPEKIGWGKKIMRWFEKKNIDTKGIKNIAAGVVATVILTPAAMKIMQMTADKDNAKIAKTEQKALQNTNQDMSKVYDMNQNVRS